MRSITRASTSASTSGRVGAHAAGVLAPVAVERALVVLCRRQTHEVLAVGDRVERGLFAEEALLDDDAASRLAEAPVAHRLCDRLAGLRGIVADGHTLARREPVRLHDQGTVLGGDPAVGLGGLLEDAEVRGRNPVARHERLRERLAPLELSRLRARTEDRHPQRADTVGDPRDEWVLRTHDDEARALPAHECEQSLGIA
jgi:hypothetical protein